MNTTMNKTTLIKQYTIQILKSYMKYNFYIDFDDDDLLPITLDQTLENKMYIVAFLDEIERTFLLPPIPFKLNSTLHFEFDCTIKDFIEYINPTQPIQPTREELLYNISFIHEYIEQMDKELNSTENIFESKSEREERLLYNDIIPKNKFEIEEDLLYDNSIRIHKKQLDYLKAHYP